VWATTYGVRVRRSQRRVLSFPNRVANPKPNPRLRLSLLYSAAPRVYDHGHTWPRRAMANITALAIALFFKTYRLLWPLYCPPSMAGSYTPHSQSTTIDYGDDQALCRRPDTSDAHAMQYVRPSFTSSAHSDWRLFSRRSTAAIAGVTACLFTRRESELTSRFTLGCKKYRRLSRNCCGDICTWPVLTLVHDIAIRACVLLLQWITLGWGVDAFYNKNR